MEFHSIPNETWYIVGIDTFFFCCIFALLKMDLAVCVYAWQVGGDGDGGGVIIVVSDSKSRKPLVLKPFDVVNAI